VTPVFGRMPDRQKNGRRIRAVTADRLPANPIGRPDYSVIATWAAPMHTTKSRRVQCARHQPDRPRVTHCTRPVVSGDNVGLKLLPGQ